MKYVHVYGDDAGETHFKDVPYSMTSGDYAPPAPPIDISAHSPASGMVTIAFPAGWYGDYHPAPKKQWMVFLTGKFEIGVSAGETRVIGPGTVVLADEVGSKGHTTRVLGDDVASIMSVEID